jgi:hypothetical protein
MKIKYKLKEVSKDIYLCTINDSYDLAMTFCRVQEFYESPLEEFRGKKFNMFELMKRYALKNENGVFCYPVQWAGFNIPGSVVADMFTQGIDDFNVYDNIIYAIHNKIKKKNYYLIASKEKDTKTIEHELCHAYYFLDKNYQEAMNKLVDGLPDKIFKSLKKTLKNMGYCEDVLKDEIQAYMSTGIKDVLDIKISKKYTKPFKQFFKKYKKAKNK